MSIESGKRIVGEKWQTRDVEGIGIGASSEAVEVDPLTLCLLTRCPRVPEFGRPIDFGHRFRGGTGALNISVANNFRLIRRPFKNGFLIDCIAVICVKLNLKQKCGKTKKIRCKLVLVVSDILLICMIESKIGPV